MTVNDNQNHPMISEALEELNCGKATFGDKNAEWVDNLCEANDGLGTLQGWTFRMDGGITEPCALPAVDLVFEHGIVSAYLPDLEIFAKRDLYRVDEITLDLDDEEDTHEPIPSDYPVQPLQEGDEAKERATCGNCGLSWDDAIVTSMTPVPSGRCPFESFHN